MEKNPPRRTFVKTLVLAGGAIFILPIFKLQQAWSAAVNPTDPLVKALGYVNVEQAEKDLQSKDAAVQTAAKNALKDRKDKKAYCHACQYYGDVTGNAASAKCQLIPSGEVLSQGWCHSYSARPVSRSGAKKS